jgi:RHH-type transcriptional regulator, proline utilization regulon repressor / proline dehydrogenase / delta 1-pyrroline-5-carboxylate dehydrogenase
VQELRIGRTDALNVDIGPVISAEAKETIAAHIAAMRTSGAQVEQQNLPADAINGTFVAPTIIEIKDIAELGREVFGPVLHVVRYRRDRLNALIDAINATGYGLTFGLHTRLDETVAHVTSRIRAGNLYVNRNVIGAIVGVQPFGGCGLSGTGPKAGGPLYLGRLVDQAPGFLSCTGHLDSPIHEFADWLEAQGEPDSAAKARRYSETSALGVELALPGPVGERNLYALHPRGQILLYPATKGGLFEQMAAVLATGNRGTVKGMTLPSDLPTNVAAAFSANAAETCAAALVEGDSTMAARVGAEVASLPGPIVSVHAARSDTPLSYQADWLLEEVSISINTTAAGGNASLMMIG